jgi:2-polyprenylphenol 6-hydroxylase
VSRTYDIAVIGGGMVGLAAVAALAETGVKVLLIEKQPVDFSQLESFLGQQSFNPTECDLRVSAISPANRQFLSSLGVWQMIPKSALASYDWMKVWDGDGTGYIEFSAQDIAEPDLGVIVENRLIQAALIERIQSFGNVTCVFAAQVENIKVNDDAVELLLDNDESMCCRLLIGADGAHSQVKEKLAIQTSQSDYQQTAFVANVRTELPHQNTAWQRFTPFGPVAFLPLAEPHHCSVVWSLDKAKADKLKDLDVDSFAAKLQAAFESRLGHTELVSDFRGFELIKRHSENYLLPRVALIGDAAHTIHPLAGQGVNIGFQDVVCLTDLIKQLQQKGRDYTLLENLRPFERERKTENLIMQNAMSGFKLLFANQWLPVTLIRNFAMSALNNIPMAKQAIIKKAMGI